MRKFLASLLARLLEKISKDDVVEKQVAPVVLDPVKEVLQEIQTVDLLKPQKKKSKITPESTELIPHKENPARDLMEMMEVPFLALSKNRKNPIIYESQDGRVKVKVSRHTGHFLASIYDWDIILFVASKMQDILNQGNDIPPRSLIVPRHELLKVLCRKNIKKQQQDLESSLARLQRTGIDTTIRNEDYRYRGGFGFLDSWGYTERKDIKEITITLSQWLYDGICAKGALLKVDSAYFSLTSGLKKFLYRTARKHVGQSLEPWEFSVEKLYEKSGSEREYRKFKSDLRAAVLANDIPNYTMAWVQRSRKEIVIFRRSNIPSVEQSVEDTDIETIQKGEILAFPGVYITDLFGGDITDKDNSVDEIH